MKPWMPNAPRYLLFTTVYEFTNIECQFHKSNGPYSEALLLALQSSFSWFLYVFVRKFDIGHCFRRCVDVLQPYKYYPQT